MPITKTGRYSMNPAYAEHLDRAAQNNADEQDDSTGAPDNADGKKDGEKNAPKKGAVKRIEIEPAENGGYVSRTHREQTDDEDDDARGGWALPYQEPELRAHPDAAHLIRFLGHELEK